jgi:hypothetical protein
MVAPWCALHYLKDLVSQPNVVNVPTVKPSKVPIVVQFCHHVIDPLVSLPVFPIVLSRGFNILETVVALCGVASATGIH